MDLLLSLSLVKLFYYQAMKLETSPAKLSKDLTTPLNNQPDINNNNLLITVEERK